MSDRDDGGSGTAHGYGNLHTYKRPTERQTNEVKATEALYDERARCVIALARVAQSHGCRVWFDEDPALDEAEKWKWPVLFVDLPTGQVSWHLTYDQRATLALDIQNAVTIGYDCPRWDGHTTEEKYRRLEEWSRSLEVSR